MNRVDREIRPPSAAAVRKVRYTAPAMSATYPASSPDALAPLPLERCLVAPCLLLEEGPDGWSGLYCAQGREGPEETADYLSARYPDGLARLRSLGDLAALGGRPESCDAMDSDGEYGPARDPDYPPAAEPTPQAACAAWAGLKSPAFVCLYANGSWRLADARGRPLPRSRGA